MLFFHEEVMKQIPPESSRKQNTGRLLARCAIALWLLSLVFPVFSIGIDGKEFWPGWAVLLFGWLGPVNELNVAWFANLFFLYVYFKVALGKPAFWSILIMLPLSFDSFRFRHIPSPGGSGSTVTGYGWGFLLWFLAIFILVIANGFVESDRKNEYRDAFRRWMKKAAICLVIVEVTIIPFYLVHDHLRGNAEEKARLSRDVKNGRVFRFGSVCTEPVPSRASPLIVKKGPVVVRFAYPAEQSWSFYAPFYGVDELLSWGIPSIRAGARDFFHQRVGNEVILVSRPATGETVANILVDHIEQTITLQDGSGNNLDKQAFRMRNGKYCPSYHIHPSPDYNPRKWITQALGVSAVKHEKSEENPAAMEVVQDETIDFSSLPTPEIALSEEKRSFNQNCPANVGIVDTEKLERWRQHYPAPTDSRNFFRIDALEFELKFSFRDPVFIGASCAPDHVYLLAQKEGTMEMEKHALPSFERIWGARYSLQDWTKTKKLRAMTFKEQPDGTLAIFQFHDEANPPSVARIVQLKIHGGAKPD
jgi:hypothetical protein